MDVKHDMDEGERRIFGPGWRLDSTWMEVRQDSWVMDAGEAGLNRSKIHIMGPGWVSDWTWMDMRCSFRDLHKGEMWAGWGWDANIKTWIEASCNLDGCETLISCHVPIISPHLHPGDISLQSKFRNCISIPSCSHLNAIQVSSPSKSYFNCTWALGSTLYTCHLISIKVPRLSSLPHPCCVSPPS